MDKTENNTEIFQCVIAESGKFKNLISIYNCKLKKIRFLITEDSISIFEIEENHRETFHQQTIFKREQLLSYSYNWPEEQLIFSLPITKLGCLTSDIKPDYQLKLMITNSSSSVNNIFNLHVHALHKKHVDLKDFGQMRIMIEEDFYKPEIPEELYVKYPTNIKSADIKFIKKLKSMKQKLELSIQTEGILIHITEEDLKKGTPIGKYDINKKPNFSKKFDSSFSVLISKMAILSDQISFYHIKNVDEHSFTYSLKISSDIGTYGKFILYIKDEEQIEQEKSIGPIN